MSSDFKCKASLMTPRAPGAIAIIQLHGDVVPVLGELTGKDTWPIGQLRLASLDGIDEGLVVRLSPEMAQLMPHGGLRVVQRIMARLCAVGVSPCDIMPVLSESANEVEGRMLRTLAYASSPLAIEPLLAQPDVWQRLAGRPLTDTERERSRQLNHLLTPPLVVLAGSPNVGKSTLSNALLGRSMSLAIDMPGTTRDYTSVLIDLNGLVVHWHDTPGIRRTRDAIEDKAIALSRDLIARADLLIAVTDAEHDWLPLDHLGRQPDIRVANKSDIGNTREADVRVSALTGEGMARLVQVIREAIVPEDVMTHALECRWIFDQQLIES